MRRFLALLPLLAACSNGPESRSGAEVATVASVSPVVARAIAASLEPLGGGVMEDGVVRRRVAALCAEVAEAMGARVELTVLDTSDVVLRPLPGGYLQVSRGLLVACAGEGAREEVAALLAHGIAHVKAGAPVFTARSVNVSGIADGSTEADEAAELGRALRALHGPPLVRTFGGDATPCGEAIEPLADRALASLGIHGPRGIAEACMALALIEDGDPGRLRPFVTDHGPLVGRLQAARGAARVTVTGARSAGEPLDLAPLLAQAPTCALIDAAALLVRRGAPDAALRLIADQRGARAAIVRGLAHLSKDEPREGERALRTALLLAPDSYAARLALGDAYAAMSRPEAARAEYLEALRLAPLSPEVHYKLGLVEADRALGRRRLEIARALAGEDDPIARRAAEVLEPARGEVEAPERERIRILSGSGGGD